MTTDELLKYWEEFCKLYPKPEQQDEYQFGYFLLGKADYS